MELGEAEDDINQNWDNLPEELVMTIAEKVKSIDDFIRFGGVCLTWRCVTRDKLQYSLFLKPPFPWLMVTTNEDENRRHFLDLSDNRVRLLNLPDTRGCQFWGSPYGWLLTLGGVDHRQFRLLNPLNKACLPLPSRSTIHDMFHEIDATPKIPSIRRAVVAKCEDRDSGNVDNFIVFLNLKQTMEVAFARPGDDTWITIGSSSFQDDMLYFKGILYTLNYAGFLMHCDITGGWNCTHPTLYHLANPPRDLDEYLYRNFYLLELCGKLHMVGRIRDCFTPEPPLEFHHVLYTVYFEVYRLDWNNEEWERVRTLGDHAFFIGQNTSFALKGSDYPNCKPNCIYFTDDHDKDSGRLVGRDMGVFDLKSCIILPLYEGDVIVSRFSPPCWITPNFLLQ